MAEGKGVSSRANLLISVKVLVGDIVDIWSPRQGSGLQLALCYIERKYKEIKMKGNWWAWKKCIMDEGATDPPQKHP
jgi:hypothetical protein